MLVQVNIFLELFGNKFVGAMFGMLRADTKDKLEEAKKAFVHLLKVRCAPFAPRLPTPPPPHPPLTGQCPPPLSSGAVVGSLVGVGGLKVGEVYGDNKDKLEDASRR